MVWQTGQKISFSEFLYRQGKIVVIFIILFLLLSVRLFYLQVLRGDYYRRISEQQRIFSVNEQAPRGIIYGADGSMLVQNTLTYSVVFYPFDKSGMPTDLVINELNSILKKDIRPYLEESMKTGKMVVISENISTYDMFRIRENRLNLNGVHVLEFAQRLYNNPGANSHIFGYTGEITKEELAAARGADYKQGDYIGRGGIEEAYDKYLRGIDGGWQIEVNVKGIQTSVFRYIPPVIGNSIYTTIDPKLQEAAYQGLSNSSTGRGAVVVIDVRSGAVKALVSAPSFDANRVKAEDFAQYLKDRKLPLYNRATQALYAPGSIFKIVGFAAALENGVDPKETKFCPGYFDLGNKRFLCWLHKGHGKVDLAEALAQSCNVYFYNLALRLGINVIDEFAYRFHLGELTGIDLPNEKRGFVPTPEWKRERARGKERGPWGQGDTVNVGVGQGALWVTPLQMAVMMASVASKGTYYEPYIVDNIVSHDGKQLYAHKVKKGQPIKLAKRTWDLLHEALIGTVERGTARRLYFENIKVAGKTGTAQNPQGDDHAWIVTFAPADDPEIAIAVIVENGGGGSANAAPIARMVYEAYFEKRLAIKTNEDQ
ncbi:MAG: penicillin-binding protein 2 [Elusimicrobiota bacterium]|nr:penicillin-binding protein 2 [Elusimicrobiota bacterium]